MIKWPKPNYLPQAANGPQQRYSLYPLQVVDPYIVIICLFNILHKPGKPKESTNFCSS